MPQTPHIERHFTASNTIRGIIIGMSNGASRTTSVATAMLPAG